MTGTIPLGQLITIRGGGTPSRSIAAYWNGGIRWATVKDFKSTELAETEESITPEGINDSATNIIPAGSVIVPTRMAVGKAAINTIDLAINQDLKALLPGREVDSRFLLYFMLAQGQYLERHAQGATVKGIKLDLLRSLPFPKISPSEQRRIATILDKADGIRRKRARALTMADELLKAAFLDVFGDPLTNRKRLPVAPIKDFGRVITGNTPPRANPENYGDKIEWIKSDNINTPEHFLTPADEHLSEVGKSLARTAPAGSTLVTCIAGSPSVIGNAALADREVAFNQQINAVVPSRDTNPYFLYCQFLVGKKLIQAHSANSMKGMVSKGKFQEIKFLRPSYEAQRKFGRLVQNALRSRDRIREDVLLSEQLFGSLSTLAFHGDL